MEKKPNLQKNFGTVIDTILGIEKHPEARIFHDKEGKCPECLDYIEKLNPEFAPFNCPYMKVLIEDMKVLKENCPLERYAQEELLCLELARKGVSRRCGVRQEITINKSGAYEVLCKAGIYKFTLMPTKKE